MKRRILFVSFVLMAAVAFGQWYTDPTQPTEFDSAIGYGYLLPDGSGGAWVLSVSNNFTGSVWVQHWDSTGTATMDQQPFYTGNGPLHYYQVMAPVVTSDGNLAYMYNGLTWEDPPQLQLLSLMMVAQDGTRPLGVEGTPVPRMIWKPLFPDDNGGVWIYYMGIDPDSSLFYRFDFPTETWNGPYVSCFHTQPELTICSDGQGGVIQFYEPSFTTLAAQRIRSDGSTLYDPAEPHIIYESEEWYPNLHEAEDLANLTPNLTMAGFVGVAPGGNSINPVYVLAVDSTLTPIWPDTSLQLLDDGSISSARPAGPEDMWLSVHGNTTGSKAMRISADADTVSVVPDIWGAVEGTIDGGMIVTYLSDQQWYAQKFYRNGTPAWPEPVLLLANIQILGPMNPRGHRIPDSTGGVIFARAYDTRFVDGSVIGRVTGDGYLGNNTAVAEHATPALPTSLSITLYPNPCNTSTIVTLAWPGNESPDKLQVHDMLGRLVWSVADLGVSPGTSTIQIPLTVNGFSSGTYIISAGSSSSVVSKRLTVLK